MDWANGQIRVSLRQPDGSYATQTIAFEDWEGRLKVLLKDFVAKKATLDTAVQSIVNIDANIVVPDNPLVSYVQLAQYMNSTEAPKSAREAAVTLRDKLQAEFDDLRRQIYQLAYLGDYGSRVQPTIQLDVQGVRYRLEVFATQDMRVTVI